MVASQDALLAGHAPPGPSAQRLAEIYARQLVELEHWLGGRPGFSVLELDYGRLLADPSRAARSLDGFLGVGLDTEAMAGAVAPDLWHQRA